ncbi:MAG TPA: acyl-CoA dehydrogenase family protein, partial [Actinokineospora sp.]|nr:acyl-CoA dehydrogenase family protein [Actinokineospora sp.]
LSPELRAFAATIDAFLSKSDVPAVARAWAAADHGPGLTLWRGLADLGVLGLTEPVDLAVAFEAVGRFAVPGPLIESVAVVPRLAPHLASSLAEGTLIATTAIPPHVPYAVDADIAEVVPPGVSGVGVESVDRTRRLFPATGGDDAAFDWGVLACSAQLVGLAQAMLDQTVAHAKTRTQFGRPIGQFQAVKHQLADVHVAIDFARPLVYGAAVTMAPIDVSAAKVAAGEAANLAGRAALQIHGAVGYTQECDLGLWLTKARALRSSWGTAAAHRGRILTELGADASAAR